MDDSVIKHGLMISDQLRMDAYASALRRSVRPGSIVVDIGSGTGIFALLACKFGAAKVYAIEPDPVIELAMELASNNGFANRIEFIQEFSTRVTLPERADVVVSDIRGRLPLFQQAIPAIVDARERMLSPGGALIPFRDSLWVGLVKDPQVFGRHIDIWECDLYGLDLSRARDFSVNIWQPVELQEDQMLPEPKCWTTLDYTHIDSPNVSGQISWSISQPETAYGLGLWFETELNATSGFSNAPGKPKTIYGRLFAPWPQPVILDSGDTVCVKLNANLFGDEYIWAWKTQVFERGDSDHIKVEFEQSSLMGQPLPIGNSSDWRIEPGMGASTHSVWDSK